MSYGSRGLSAVLKKEGFNGRYAARRIMCELWFTALKCIVALPRPSQKRAGGSRKPNVGRIRLGFRRICSYTLSGRTDRRQIALPLRLRLLP